MADPITGVDILLYVNTGTVASPVWTAVGGQRGCTLNRSADEIDASDKTTGGWKKTLPGLLNWSMDCDAVLLDSDNAYDALESAYENRTSVLVKMERPDGRKYQGEAHITDFPMEAPQDDVASISITLSGKGALTRS